MSVRIAAVVPSAGLSSRMDGFKPLLPLGHGTVLASVVESLRGAGVGHVLVVAGHRAGEVRAEADRLGIESVLNPDYPQGMFSSMRTGLAALPPGFDAVFVLPVDIPLVRTATVRALIKRWTAEKGRPVLYPTFRGERGHPPLLSRDILPRVFTWDGTDGLRGVLAEIERESGVDELPVADANILFDLDHPEDYREALRREKRSGRPSQAETVALLAMQAVSPRGLAHAEAVAKAAMAMARALNEARSLTIPRLDSSGCGSFDTLAGPMLDLALVESAALLHDMAKGSPNHEAEGGRLLDAAGFPDAARIVEAHRDIDLPNSHPITEREVVYLADKLVSCDRSVDVRTRFQEKLDRFGHDPGAAQAILGRRDRALTLLGRVEAEAGKDIGAILASEVMRT